jgi:hypothetical protein
MRRESSIIFSFYHIMSSSNIYSMMTPISAGAPNPLLFEFLDAARKEDDLSEM